MRERIILLSQDNVEPENVGSYQVFTPEEEFPAEFSGSKIVFATDESGDDVVLKYSAYPKGAQREWRGLLHVAHHNFVQQPLLLGLDEETNEIALVTQRALGQVLRLSDEESLRYQVGMQLATLHEHTPISGQGWERSQKADWSYFADSIAAWSQPEKALLFSSTIALPLVQRLLSTVESLVRLPAFTHQDLHEGQVLVSGDDTTIIDFEAWLESDPLEDLAICLFHCLREQQSLSLLGPLFEGYFLEKEYEEAERQLLSFYALFIATRAVNYFATYRPKYLSTAIDSLQRVATFVDTEKLWKPS